MPPWWRLLLGNQSTVLVPLRAVRAVRAGKVQLFERDIDTMWLIKIGTTNKTPLSLARFCVLDKHSLGEAFLIRYRVSPLALAMNPAALCESRNLIGHDASRQKRVHESPHEARISGLN